MIENKSIIALYNTLDTTYTTHSTLYSEIEQNIETEDSPPPDVTKLILSSV